MYNKEPAAAAAEAAATEMAAVRDAPDVNEQTEDTADVVKQKREVNGTADADVRTLQAENRHRTEISVLAQNMPAYWLELSKIGLFKIHP